VVASAYFNAVVKVLRRALDRMGCVPADTKTLKSVEVHNERFENERDSSLEAARSLLFIEAGECRAVVMTHMGLRLQILGTCNRR